MVIYKEQSPRIVIVGLGPTGIGACVRLTEQGYSNWAAYEAEGVAGGLSRSFKDEAGFFWDIGGHVVFSHYDYYDEVLKSLGCELNVCQRECKVLFNKGKVQTDYPIQKNLHQLPEDMYNKCVDVTKDLQEQINNQQQLKPGQNETMEDWALKIFGKGLYELFVKPYNFSVWAYPLHLMSSSWVSDRVAPVDFRKANEKKEETKTWGPNNQLRYPVTGGIGRIFTSITNNLDQKKLHYNKTISKIDLEKKKIFFNDGTDSESFDYLITTAPLDQIHKFYTGFKSQHMEILKTVENLCHSSTHAVGLGIKLGPNGNPPIFHWAYFPESDCHFYRCICLTNLSPWSGPNTSENPNQYCGLLFEVSESKHKSVPPPDKLINDIIASAKAYGLINEGDEIVSQWTKRVEYGYPTPSVGFEPIVDSVVPLLQREYNIYTRGRFGGWKYEVGNMDHSFMQGVESIDSIMSRIQYPFADCNTYFRPQLVNTTRSTIPFSRSFKNSTN